MVTIKNDFIKAEISEKGAELKSVTALGKEYVWQADPEFWGKSCPILGRISMDYTTIALDPDTKWQKGDTVTLVGQDGAEQIAMDEWADLKQTHVYDVLCSISPRVNREYC